MNKDGSEIADVDRKKDWITDRLNRSLQFIASKVSNAAIPFTFSHVQSAAKYSKVLVQWKNTCEEIVWQNFYRVQFAIKKSKVKEIWLTTSGTYIRHKRLHVRIPNKMYAKKMFAKQDMRIRCNHETEKDMRRREKYFFLAIYKRSVICANIYKTAGIVYTHNIIHCPTSYRTLSSVNSTYESVSQIYTFNLFVIWEHDI